MQIIEAAASGHLAAVRDLFREYERFLNADLCFQGFEEELAGLPGKYASPEGALLLAVEADDGCGCVALRRLEPEACNMKRLYVRPAYRCRGLARALAEAIISGAARKGYAVMRFDTLTRLLEAIRLYERLGFRKIDFYYDNPLPGVTHWELDLKKWRRYDL